MLTIIVMCFLSLSGIEGHSVNTPRVAIAHLSNDRINGTIVFTEIDAGIHVTGLITGLKAGHYGFHVHELGDITTCYTTGPHFNPDNVNHGGRDHEVRHVGDFGNVEFTYNGALPIGTVNFVDTFITLRGRNNILGRALVLHEGTDDLGLGGDDMSLLSGNSGPRIACGVIGIRSPGTLEEQENSAKSFLPSVVVIVSGLCALFNVFNLL